MEFLQERMPIDWPDEDLKKADPALILEYICIICKLIFLIKEGLEQQLEQDFEKDDNLNEYEALL